MNESKVLNKYPRIFRDKDESPQKTLICFGLSVGDGWLQLIDNLCSEIKEITDSVIATQVKEKYGCLEFYYTFEKDNDLNERDREALRLLVRKYKIKSMYRCEICGNKGHISSSGTWVKTLCSNHREKNDYKKLDDNTHKIKTWKSSKKEAKDYIWNLVEASKKIQDYMINVNESIQYIEKFSNFSDFIIQNIENTTRFLNKWYKKPFSKLKSYATKMEFWGVDYIRNGERNLWQSFWDKIISCIDFFEFSINPFYKLNTRLKYKIERIHSSEENNLGELVEINVERQIILFGYEVS